MLFAVVATSSVMAQDAKQSDKPKTECSSKKSSCCKDKDKKEGCTKKDKDSKCCKESKKTEKK